MKIYIMFTGLQVWISVQTGYIYPKYPPTDLEGIKQFGYNAKAVNAILVGLGRTIFAEVKHCKTTQDIQDKLHTIYEGDTKVKHAKLQTFKINLEV